MTISGMLKNIEIVKEFHFVADHGVYDSYQGLNSWAPLSAAAGQCLGNYSTVLPAGDWEFTFTMSRSAEYAAMEPPYTYAHNFIYGFLFRKDQGNIDLADFKKDWRLSSSITAFGGPGAIPPWISSPEDWYYTAPRMVGVSMNGWEGDVLVPLLSETRHFHKVGNVISMTIPTRRGTAYDDLDDYNTTNWMPPQYWQGNGTNVNVGDGFTIGECVFYIGDHKNYYTTQNGTNRAVIRRIA